MTVVSNFLDKYKQILVFLFVGGNSALIDVGSLYLFSKMLDWNNELSVTIAFLLGLVFNYFAHTHFTFQKKVGVVNLTKYLILVLINYLNTLFLIYVLNEWLSVDIVIAKVITLPIIAITTFVISKIWVYK